MSIPIEELERRLGAWASGSTGTEAAVELLIETEYWLTRAEFVDRAIKVHDDAVSVDWPAARLVAAEVQCSRGERFLLQLACSFADSDQTVAMSEVSALDGRSLGCVLAALRTARFGW